ncbi:pyridoxal phosphate-dependent decarboxylase family protein [Methylibium sp.]|uniref:pyridoxal phosphate-dependent decarboxylase family protein n=1 Tax=Methylibium sp. TaxID=2067992 RepID=UPI003D107DD4
MSELLADARSPYSGIDPQVLRQKIFDFPLTQSNALPLAEAIDEACETIARHSILVQHPSCIAHLHTPPMISGIAAERFISLLNPSMDSWDQSGSATFVEERVVAWLTELFQLGSDADGVFTSGGTQGNIMALLMARDSAIQQRSGHNVQQDGLPDYFSTLRIVGSTKSHFTLKKAASIMGLGEKAVVDVQSLPDGSMDIQALRAKMVDLERAGLIPFAIVGTAGTTDHGAIDDLEALALVAQRHNAWFHVDAAYGGALMLSGAKHRLSGIQRANSVVVDFHKLWFQPISCGALLLKDKRNFSHLRHHADYLNRETDDLPNLVDKAISTTRRFDALKVWMMLRSVGDLTMGEMVDHLLMQTKAVAALVQKLPAFELLAKPNLSTVLFRFIGRSGQAGDVNDFNRCLRARLLKSGVAVIGETTLDGRAALKLTILNPCLPMRHFESLFQLIEEVALEL